MKKNKTDTNTNEKYINSFQHKYQIVEIQKKKKKIQREIKKKEKISNFTCEMKENKNQAYSIQLNYLYIKYISLFMTENRKVCYTYHLRPTDLSDKCSRFFRFPET